MSAEDHVRRFSGNNLHGKYTKLRSRPPLLNWIYCPNSNNFIMLQLPHLTIETCQFRYEVEGKSETCQSFRTLAANLFNNSLYSKWPMGGFVDCGRGLCIWRWQHWTLQMQRKYFFHRRMSGRLWISPDSMLLNISQKSQANHRCAITIKELKERDAGQWQCRVKPTSIDIRLTKEFQIR